MRNAAASFLAIGLLALVPSLAYADDAKGFSDPQKAAIEDIVKKYLTEEHPEVIMQAVQELQKRDMAAAETKSKEAITASHDKIYNNPDTPVGGNPKGDVTVVEFFDYQCPYCKSSHQTVEELLKNDSKVKFLYEEYPILGPASTTAAKAAFASVRQGKYVAYHNALMKAPFSHNAHPDADDALVYKTAKDVGLDVDKLKKDMADPAIQKMVDDSLALGGTLGVRGTPMFIVAEKTYPGALQYDQLKQAVDEARAAKKTP